MARSIDYRVQLTTPKEPEMTIFGMTLLAQSLSGSPGAAEPSPGGRDRLSRGS